MRKNVIDRVAILRTTRKALKPSGVFYHQPGDTVEQQYPREGCSPSLRPLEAELAWLGAMQPAGQEGGG